MTNHSPSRYFIHLEPDLEELTFRGSMRLRTNLEKSGTRIGLDAVDLEIDSCAVTRGADGGSPLDASCRTGDGGLVIDFDEVISGEIEVAIDYRGEINDLMAGFYRSRYSIDGTEKFLAVTQFEERDARRAFPCVDRPAYKAVFDIEIVAPSGHTAIANTSVESVVDRPDGSRLFRFRRTPPVSTYLVFFGVGPFDIEVDESWRVPIRVAVSPGKGADARVSLEYAKQSVSYLEDFTGVPYPLDKLDSIGVTDFAYGAMENFGAIVYRENYLLSYPESTTRAETERMMGIAAHEIAHQWFGDLVSPADWRYVWLNEAFATYFGNVVTDHWYPEWRTMDQFVLGGTSSAMGRDGLPRSVPIELETDDEVEIDASTAPIVYSKGASVLRMVRGYYGDEAFRSGARSFLDDYKFEAADTEQFLASFGSGVKAAAAVDVSPADLLRSWIRQAGVPLVRVAKTDGRLRLTQERFSYLEPSAAMTWPIPITGTSTGGAQVREILDRSELVIDAPDPAEYVKINADQTGYYRVFYEDEEYWSALGRAAADGVLAPLDRYGLVSDLAAFVTAGMVRFERYLEFLRTYYTDESEYVVVAQIAGALTGFLSLLDGREDVAACIREVLGSWATELLPDPSDEEPYRNVLLRDSVLWVLHLAGETQVRDAYLRRFETVREGGSIHPDLYPLSVRVALSEDPGVLPWIEARIESESVPEGRKVQLIRALAAARDGQTAKEAMDYVLEKVPGRNRLHYLRSAGGSPAARRHLWDWFVENFSELSQIHPYHLGSTIAAIVPSGGLGRESEVKEFLENYRRNEPRVSEGVLDVALQWLEIHRRFLDREA